MRMIGFMAGQHGSVSDGVGIPLARRVVLPERSSRGLFVDSFDTIYSH